MANGMSRALAWKTAPGAVRRYSLVSIKSWNCPGCHRDFIVEAEATRDTCPWCNKTVEEKGGVLQVIGEGEKQEDKPPNPASTEGSPAASGSSDTGSGATGAQSWWPFEYSS